MWAGMFLSGKPCNDSMICHYYLTYECNCRCDYCSVWQDSGPDNSVVPSYATLERNLFDLKKLGCREVLFTGGEPLLYEDLPSAAKLAKNNGFYVSLSTNGLLAAKKLPPAAADIDRVYISLDYPLKQEHDAVKAQECFSEAVDAVRIASRLGIEPVISYTLTRDSIRFIPEMAELSHDLEVRMRFVPVHHCPELEGFESISLEYIKRYSKNDNVAFDAQLFDLMRKGGNDPKQASCRIMSNVISISPDDHLMMPCFWALQGAVPIGGDLEKLMTSDIVKGYGKLQGTLVQCRGCLAAESLDRSLRGRIKSMDIPGGLLSKVRSFIRGA